MHAGACVKVVDVLIAAISSCTGQAIPSMGAVILSLAAGEVGSFPMALVVRLAGWSDSIVTALGRSLVNARSMWRLGSLRVGVWPPVASGDEWRICHSSY